MFGNILEMRRRMNSAMTYNDYLKQYDLPPPTPKLKPKEYANNDIPEISLDSICEDSYNLKKNYTVLTNFQSETDLAEFTICISRLEQIDFDNISSLKLMKRSQSETNHTRKRKFFTFLSFLEQRIQKKKSYELPYLVNGELQIQDQ